MIRSCLGTTVGAIIAAGLAVTYPASGQEEADQRFGTVHFPTSCNETAQRRFDRGMRYQHSSGTGSPRRYSRTSSRPTPNARLRTGASR